MPDKQIDRDRTEWTFHRLANIFPRLAKHEQGAA
jgi:hypothetical protein